MTKYRSLFQNCLSTKFLNEAVIRPENYLNSLLEKLNNIKKEIINKNYSSKQIGDFLNNEFKDDKILFKYAKGDEILQKARYNVNTSDIHLIYDEGLKEIQKEELSYEIFFDHFKEMVGHELIHRLQFLKDKIKSVKSYKDISKEEDLIKYLSDKKEIMSHAWQTIQMFKMSGLENKEILKFIQDPIKNKIYARIIAQNILFRNYYRYFDKKSPILKRYYKYMYEYLRG